MYRRIFTTFQWVAVVVLCIVVSYNLWKKPDELDYFPETWTSWKGFSVIVYSGITKKKGANYVTPSKLKEHIIALREGGYQTITPRDARAFLDKTHALPDKAVLIVFSGIRKDNFIYSTKALSSRGMLATLCVPTGLINTYGSFYLHDDDIKMIAKIPNWSFCSMGDSATNPITVSADAKQGHFLSQRQFTGNEMESTLRYASRIDEDFAKSKGILTELAGKNIDSYLFPYNDDGTGEGADPNAKPIIRRAVKTRYLIAFTDSGLNFNGIETDPYNVSMIQINEHVSGEALMELLESDMPATGKISMSNQGKRFIMKGPVERSTNGFAFRSSSAVLVNGTNEWSDADVSFKVTIQPESSFSLYTRYKDTSSFTRVNISENELKVQEHTGEHLYTITRYTLPPESDKELNIRFLIKNNRAWLWLNGTLTGEPTPLTITENKGRIWFESYNGENAIRDIEVIKLTETYVETDAYDALSDDMKVKTTAFIPQWFSTDSDTFDIDDQKYKTMLIAASYGTSLIPYVTNTRMLSAARAGSIAAAIADALRKQKETKGLVRTIAIDSTNANLVSSFHSLGYNLLVKARANEVSCNGQLSIKDIVFIEGSAGKVAEGLNRMLSCTIAQHIAITKENAYTSASETIVYERIGGGR